MSSIRIQKIGITSVPVDCVVNAANSQLQRGGGVCGAIFSAAGCAQLQNACDMIGYCPTGSAVITPGFGLKAKYIIHAVGPIWNGGNSGEKKLLYSCYTQALKLAMANGIHSIAFPLISAGIYGVPKDVAWRKALQACKEFLEINDDYELDIVFTVLDGQIMKLGLAEMQAQNITENSFGKRPLAKTPDGQTVAALKYGLNRTELLTIDGRNYPAVFFHMPEEPNGYLSNWYCSDFTLDGRKFTSSEQYIMYRKCMALGNTASADAVLATDNPKIQQAIAKSVKYNETIWNGMRQVVAMEALLAKFGQNEDLRQALLDTGDAYLVECASHDSIWACGVGLQSKEKYELANWKGKNILGFALMEVRRMLRLMESNIPS